MKIAEIDTDDLPVWMCAVVDVVSENCKKRLKMSPQYSRIVERLKTGYSKIRKQISREERMNSLKKTDFYDLVERIEDSFMEIDSEIIVDLKKQDEE